MIELTKADVDSLDDSCFSWIEPGGEKSADGKTSPRVLRHLPYKTAAGDVDLDLLAQALNAVPETNLPRATQAKVAARLESVAKRYAQAEGVEKYITHDGSQWKVHAESGRVLGTHDSKGDAVRQLAAVEAGKADRRKAALVGKKDVEYRMTKIGEEPVQCHLCVNYVPNSDAARPTKPGDPTMLGTCKRVAGEIEPDATCDLFASALSKQGGGTVRWPVMPRPGFRGSSLTDAGEKAPNQKRSLDEVAKEWFDRAAKPGDKPEWSDDAKAACDEAGKHGFEEDLKTDAGVRMSHAAGTHLFVAPSGKWHHGDAQGETVGAGQGAAKLGEHLGRQPDHLGALPATPATTKPAAPAVPGQPRPAPGKDPDFDKAYADFKAQVKSAVQEAAGPGSRVQTLIFDRDHYKKPAEAAAWASDHGFEGKKVDETQGSYRVRQRDPGQFERMRTISLTEGVQAVVGFPKQTLKAVRDAFFLTASGRLAFKRADIAKAECEPVSESEAGTVWCVKCAGQSLHFASAGDAAVYLPAYEHLQKFKQIDVYKSKDEQRYTLTVVYPSSTKDNPSPDFHGDVMSEEELEKSAWSYIGKGTDRVGLMHRPGTSGAGKVVESYIWRAPAWKMQDTSGQEQTVMPGSWVMGIVWSPEAWAAIKGGTITGVSLQGAAQKVAFEEN